MNRISISLNEEALLAPHEVLLDDSAEAALDFVKRYLAPALPRSGTAPCDSSRLNPFILRDKGNP